MVSKVPVLHSWYLYESTIQVLSVDYLTNRNQLTNEVGGASTGSHSERLNRVRQQGKTCCMRTSASTNLALKVLYILIGAIVDRSYV